MSPRTLLGILILIIGILGIIAGVMYLTESAHAIPSFLPGHVAKVTAGKKTKHGVAALAAGIVLFLAGSILAYTDRR